MKYRNVPPKEVHSGCDDLPCLRDGSGADCPFRHVCDSIAGYLPLNEAYGRGICVTLSEPSTSIVVRSEHQFRHDDRFRYTIRKHIHENEEYQENHHTLSLVGTASSGAVNAAVCEAMFHALAFPTAEPPYASIDVQAYKSEVRRIESLLMAQATRTASPISLPELATLFLDRSVTSRHLFKVFCKHLFPPGGCHHFRPTQKLGRYLGFLDVRQTPSRSPVALSVLAPPRRFRHDPHWVIATGDYGRIFGGVGFPATVYAMHDSVASGTYCAQAAIVMILGMLSDRGAQIMGPIDITFQAVEHQMIRARDVQCSVSESNATSAFPAHGLRIDEVARFFWPGSRAYYVMRTKRQEVVRFTTEFPTRKAPDPNVSGDVVLTTPSKVLGRLFVRTVQAYIRTRCPVLLFVDPSILDGSTCSEPHAIVVIGIRETAAKTKHFLFGPLAHAYEMMYHDPGRRPFMTRATLDIFRAARSYAKPSAGGRCAFAGFIHAAFVTSKKIVTHAIECVMHIRHARPRIAYEYIFALTVEKHGKVDFRIDLVHSDDILPLQLRRWPGLDVAEPYGDEAVRSAIDGLPVGWHWLICTYAKNSDAGWNLATWHIYPAELNCLASFQRCVAGRFSDDKISLFDPNA